MIEVEGAVKVLGGRRVLDGVTLSVAAGECVALFGPNGAGKSTLLRVLAGLSRLDAGTAKVGGVSAHAASPEARRRLGFVSHQPFLYENLSGEENLQFWARIYGVSRAGRRIAELLDWAGLLLFAGDPVRTYSRGMIQRLAIARVLLHDPEILLLDEPFTGLDRGGAEILTAMLRELRARRRTLLVVSHRPEEVADLADRFVVLAGGRIRGEWPGAPAAGERPGADGQAVAAALEAMLGRANPSGLACGRGVEAGR